MGGDEAMDLFAAEIKKDYGEGILTDARHIMDDDQKVISWSPNFDAALSGGIPEGTWVSVSGPEKSGKTSALLTLAAQCQKPENGARRIFFLNVEHRLKKKNLGGIDGLNTDPSVFHIIQSEKRRILSAQDFLSIAEKALKRFPGCMMIIDSISALVDATILENGMGTQTRGGGAKLVSQFCDLVQAVVPLNKCIVCGISHLIANTSGFGPHKIEKTGNRWLYQADVKIRSYKKDKWETTDKQIGLVTSWLVEESALGPPGKCVSYLRYGTGLDRVYETMETAKGVGLIAKAGAWLTLRYLENYPDLVGGKAWSEEVKREHTFQGSEQVYAVLRDNPRWLAALEVEVRRAQGICE